MPNPSPPLPVCAQFAQRVADALHLTRLLGELAALPEDTRRSLAALILERASELVAGEPDAPARAFRFEFLSRSAPTIRAEFGQKVRGGGVKKVGGLGVLGVLRVRCNATQRARRREMPDLP